MSDNNKILTWVFFGLACFLLAPNIVYGLREAHDTKFHLGLFLSYRDTVGQGGLYPRWLPDQLHGLGSPAAMIYPPMASAVFVLIDLLTLHTLAPERVLGLGALLLSIASGITFYLWARQSASARLALTAALFYATGPYHLNLDLYARAAMSEYTAFVWIPLIFLGIRTTLQAGKAKGVATLAIGITALFLTHLLTSMLVAPLALAYCLVCLRKEVPAGLRVRRFMLVAVTAVLGVGVAAFYFLPAVSLLPAANSAGLYRDVATTNIFFALRTLSDRFQVKLILIGCAYLVFFLYLLVETWSNWRRQRAPGAMTALALTWIVAGIMCFALMSGLFPFIFQPPSPYAQVQFGWRLLVVMEFSLASLFICIVAGTEHVTSRARLLKAGAVVLLIMGAGQCLDVVARFHNVPIFANPLQDTEQVKWRLSSIEFFPVGTDVRQRVDLAIKPFERYAVASQPAFIASGKGIIAKATREGARFTVHSIVNEPAPIMIQQFYFPGWKAFDEHGGEIAVFRDDTSRLASYMAPAGDHTIVVERVPTKQERWGMIVSLGALVLLALELGLLIRRRKSAFHRVDRLSH
jgi:hypothetical protein